jgi:hypothetical protein
MMVRFSKRCISLLVLVTALPFGTPRAEEPSPDVTMAYLAEKIPVFSYSIRPGFAHYTGDELNMIMDPKTVKVAFNHCSMWLSQNMAGQTSAYRVDFSKTEPVELFGYVVTISAAEHRDAFPYRLRFTALGGGVSDKSGAVSQIQFVSYSADNTQRLARAFIRLRTICGSGPDNDPFAR